MRSLSTQSVPAVDRVLAILELLAQSRRGMGIAELARSLALPRSSIHCLLLTLERRGYLERNSRTHRYLFSVKLLSLANLALSRIKVREIALPFLNSLSESTHLTVHMGILDGREIVLIEKIEPPGLLRLATWVGKRMSIHCTGLGKALVAHISEERLGLLIREHGLPRHNENTVTSIKKFKSQLAEIRKQGYSLDVEEDELGLCCIGVPIFDHTNEVIAAISVAGTVNQITSQNLSFIAEKVKKAATEISRAMLSNTEVAD